MFRRILFPALALSFILSGCGSAPPAFDTGAMKEAETKAVAISGIYDAAGGDWDKVPAADKKKLIEQYKTEAAVKQLFETMKSRRGGAAPMPAGANNAGK